MTRHPHRCEMTAWSRGEHVRCNEPGHYYREDGKPGSWIVCESHAIDALRWTYDSVTDLDGDPVELNADGDIVSAA